MSNASNVASRALSLELKSLQEEPVEGFRVKLADDDNLFVWNVVIFGPPETLYEGGCFKAIMGFPVNYPYAPPYIKFQTKIWHPNIYENGELCISILHPPGDDPESGEMPCERWNPAQCVRTVLLSVISLLNEPNTSSPANVDASVMYTQWKKSSGANKEYEIIIKKQVEDSRIAAELEGIKVPTTVEEYCIKTVKQDNSLDLDDYITGFDDFDNCDDYDDDASDTSVGEET